MRQLIHIGFSFFITFMLLMATHAYYIYHTQTSLSGMFNFTIFIAGFQTITIMFFGTIFGITTSIWMIHYADKSFNIKDLINRRPITTACIISPIIIGGLYDKISEIESFWVIFILSYQNGYFWENVSTSIRTVHHRKNSP